MGTEEVEYGMEIALLYRSRLISVELYPIVTPLQLQTGVVIPTQRIFPPMQIEPKVAIARVCMSTLT